MYADSCSKTTYSYIFDNDANKDIGLYFENNDDLPRLNNGLTLETFNSI